MRLEFRCNAYSSLRRRKPQYIRRQQQVKNFWICAGFSVICFPALHIAVSVGLFTTFLSFMYLDEAVESDS